MSTVSNEMAFNFGYDARRDNLPLNLTERVSWQEGWLKADGEIADECGDNDDGAGD